MTIYEGKDYKEICEKAAELIASEIRMNPGQSSDCQRGLRRSEFMTGWWNGMRRDSLIFPK